MMIAVVAVGGLSWQGARYRGEGGGGTPTMHGGKKGASRKPPASREDVYGQQSAMSSQLAIQATIALHVTIETRDWLRDG